MKFEYEISEVTTQTELVNAAKARFAEFKEQQAQLRLNNKLERVARILQGNAQTDLECSQLFFDTASKNPFFKYITMTVNPAHAPDRLVFVLTGDDIIKNHILLSNNSKPGFSPLS